LSNQPDGEARETQVLLPPPLPPPVTVKLSAEVDDALVSVFVTVMGPVTAPAGTVTTMLVEELLTTLAVTLLLNFTCMWNGSASKPVPVIVTLVSLAPLVGENADTAIVLLAPSVVALAAVDALPPAVTTELVATTL
jgi:hypothetical protein